MLRLRSSASSSNSSQMASIGSTSTSATESERDQLIQFCRCDLTLVKDTLKLCDELKSSVEKIDILVASQGILSVAGRTETAEGNDQKMMLHYYSRAATIDALQDKLAPNARVMSVLDALRGNPNSLTLDDLDLKRNFSIKRAADHCLAMNDIAL